MDAPVKNTMQQRRKKEMWMNSKGIRGSKSFYKLYSHEDEQLEFGASSSNKENNARYSVDACNAIWNNTKDLPHPRSNRVAALKRFFEHDSPANGYRQILERSKSCPAIDKILQPPLKSRAPLQRSPSCVVNKSIFITCNRPEKKKTKTSSPRRCTSQDSPKMYSTSRCSTPKKHSSPSRPSMYYDGSPKLSKTLTTKSLLVSAIMNRKSIGQQQINTPIKPVKQIRKLFSPGSCR